VRFSAWGDKHREEKEFQKREPCAVCVVCLALFVFVVVVVVVRRMTI
jgi:hypothetical protein